MRHVTPLGKSEHEPTYTAHSYIQSTSVEHSTHWTTTNDQLFLNVRFLTKVLVNDVWSVLVLVKAGIFVYLGTGAKFSFRDVKE